MPSNTTTLCRDDASFDSEKIIPLRCELIDIEPHTERIKMSSPLIEAIVCNDIEQVKSVLETGRRSLLQGNDAITPLLLAIQLEQLETVLLLIKHNVDVNQSMTDGCTPLILAIQRGHIDIALALMKAGANVNATTIHGISALITTIRFGVSLTIVDALLYYGAESDLITLNNQDVLNWLKLAPWRISCYKDVLTIAIKNPSGHGRYSVVQLAAMCTDNSELLSILSARDTLPKETQLIATKDPHVLPSTEIISTLNPAIAMQLPSSSTIPYLSPTPLPSSLDDSNRATPRPSLPIRSSVISFFPEPIASERKPSPTRGSSPEPTKEHSQDSSGETRIEAVTMTAQISKKECTADDNNFPDGQLPSWSSLFSELSTSLFTLFHDSADQSSLTKKAPNPDMTKITHK